MHSAGLELTELTYTRLEDNLIRHRCDICFDEVDKAQVQGGVLLPRQFLQSSFILLIRTSSQPSSVGSEPTLFLRQNVLAFAIVTQATRDDVVVVCCCCSHIKSNNQVRGHRTGSSHSGGEEYPRKNTHNPRYICIGVYTPFCCLLLLLSTPEIIQV